MYQIEEYLGALTDREVKTFLSWLEKREGPSTPKVKLLRLYGVGRSLKNGPEAFFKLLNEDRSGPESEVELNNAKNKFRVYCNRLTCSLKTFLVEQETPKDSWAELEVLIRFYHRRNWHRLVRKLVKKFIQQLSKEPDSVEKTSKLDWAYTVLHGVEVAYQPGMIGSFLRQSLQSAQVTSVAMMMARLCAARASSTYFTEPGFQSETDSLADIFLPQARGLAGSNRLIAAYLRIWEHLTDLKGLGFRDLMDWLTDPSGPLSYLAPSTLEEFVKLISTGIAVQINLANDSYEPSYPEWWSVLKLGLDHRLIPEEEVDARLVKNAIGSLCWAGNISEAEELHKRFKGRLKGDADDMIFEFNQGVLYFHHGLFDKALWRFESAMTTRRDPFVKIHSHAYRCMTGLEIHLQSGSTKLSIPNQLYAFNRVIQSMPGKIEDPSLERFAELAGWIKKLYGMTGEIKSVKRRLGIKYREELSGGSILPQHLTNWLLEKLKQT